MPEPIVEHCRLTPIRAKAPSQHSSRLEPIVLAVCVSVVLLALAVCLWFSSSGIQSLTGQYDPKSNPTDTELIAHFESHRHAYESARLRLVGLPIESISSKRFAIDTRNGNRRVFRKQNGQWRGDDGAEPRSLDEILKQFGISISEFQVVRNDLALLDAKSIGGRLYYRDSGDFAVTKYQVGNVASSITKGIVHASEIPYGVRVVESTDDIREKDGIWFREIGDDWFICLEID